MVPIETLQPGDVVAPAGVPVRWARPIAMVVLNEHEVELTFVVDALTDETFRAPYQYPCALIGRAHVEVQISEAVEEWLSIATGN